MAEALDVAALPAPQYFSFKDYLSEAEAAAFFELPHAAQVAKVAQYLDFLGAQPAASHFTASSKASTSFAALRQGDDCGQSANRDPLVDGAVLNKLLDGRTRSGFGAFGTEPGFLPQKSLSLAVAHTVESIGHTYIVERNKRGVVRPPVLNSRSFFFYWCHAEKQKLLDIRLKLETSVTTIESKREYWHRLVVMVDRTMCADCINFAACFARFEQIWLHIQDPGVLRIFPPTEQQSQCIPVSKVSPSSSGTLPNSSSIDSISAASS